MKSFLIILSALSVVLSSQVSKADSTSDKIAIGIIAGVIGYAAGRDSNNHDVRVEEHNRGYDRRPGHGGGYNPGGNYGGYVQGRLDASYPQCRYARGGVKICDSYISWALQGRDQYEVGAVTVAVPTSNNYNEQRDRLFACGKNGTQLANWIFPNHTYIFKLHRARDCREGGYYGRPVREVVVRAY